MLRIFLRMLSRSRATRPQAIGPPRILLYAQVDPATEAAESTDAAQQEHSHHGRRGTRKRSRVNHRAWLLSMRIEHTRLCSDVRCEALRKVGILTAGDLAASDPSKLAVRLGGSVKAAAVLKRYRRAIRLAASVPGMMPMDAMLLINIHRRSLRGLAIESPAALYRDLQRFAMSTKGRRLLRGRQVPSVRRLKKWIAACKTVIKQANSGISQGAKPKRVTTTRFHSAA